MIGNVPVKPGDILCADEAEQVTAVIPRGRLEQVLEALPSLKMADDGILKDVQDGADLKAAFKNHPEHYTHFH